MRIYFHYVYARFESQMTPKYDVGLVESVVSVHFVRTAWNTIEKLLLMRNKVDRTTLYMKVLSEPEYQGMVATQGFA